MKRELSCPVCYTVFITEKNAQKFCSAKCRHKAEYKAEKRPAGDYPCKWCGKLFHSKNGRTRYCSKECRIEASKSPIRKKKTISTLDKIAALARAEGLSYGQYVAKHNL